jgi:hypothetical protein
MLKTEGSCRGKGPGLDCIVECDGGGIYVRPRGDGVLVYLDRIRMITCDQPIEDVISDGEEVRRGKDDDVFRLDRVRGR